MAGENLILAAVREHAEAAAEGKWPEGRSDFIEESRAQKRAAYIAGAVDAARWLHGLKERS